MSTLSELLCQLSAFLKPMMDRAVEDPLYDAPRRNTFSLEINWAYINNTSETIEKKTSISTPVTKKQDGFRLSRRNLERNRRRRERRKAARALRRSSAKSPIVITSDVTPPAKTTPSPSTPMDQGTPGSLPPGDVEDATSARS